MALVETSMQFLARDSLYKNEKPYKFKYAADIGIPTSNLRYKKEEPVKVSSIRGREREFTIEKNGFAVLKMCHDMSSDDFNTEAAIQRYRDLVAEQVKTYLGADKVQVYEHRVCLALCRCCLCYLANEAQIRKRDAGFPIAKEGMDYQYNQPSTVAHIGPCPFVSKHA